MYLDTVEASTSIELSTDRSDPSKESTILGLGLGDHGVSKMNPSSGADRLQSIQSRLSYSMNGITEGLRARCADEIFSDTWKNKSDSIVTGPFDYLMELPGKNFRTQLLSALNIWLQVDEVSFGIIDKVVGMLHNASLLIDDIQDGSQLRRGAPAAHTVFGTAQTINSANYIYFLAQQELSRLDIPAEAFQIFGEEILSLHRGQGMDLFWRDTVTIPTEEEYFQMISDKTGGLFRLGVRLMQSVSSATYEILPLIELMGLIFQIRDDYLNLSSDQMTAAKGFCDDLTEGKFSFPVIHSLRNSSRASDNNDLLHILKMRTDDVRLKAHALWHIKTQTNSLHYTKSVLRTLHHRAREIAESFDVRNPAVEAILAKLYLG